MQQNCREFPLQCDPLGIKTGAMHVDKSSWMKESKLNSEEGDRLEFDSCLS
ncbi:hypothetical protein L798_02186 [Zootermopsis nevadensis]|uniref:Uncharacterized protein n=1 Tax=Zootermopsis nevadensis TaxID=136037 RepID=A0A067RRX4_ZOONE|nr:hypothetical protein L798_02186 [Zootermopsis nevadensis]